MSDDLAEFLLARIADDAMAATALTDGSNRAGWASVDFNSVECAAHGDRWSPARVQAECEAKRLAVIALSHHTPRDCRGCKGRGARYCRDIRCDGTVCGLCNRRWPCLSRFAFIVHLVPYADHPDYRPEWRP